MDSIDICFKQQTGCISNNYWFALIFKDCVKDFKGTSVKEEQASDAEAL